MKHFLSAALCAVFLLSFLLLPAQAAGDATTVHAVAVELGVLPAGQSDPSRPVTRGEFSKMLVTASTLKGTVSPAGNASPYKDVPYTHPYASYIKTAVQKGWLSGYLDGAFRPDKTVTAAEAATAVLALLGFSCQDFSGSYPEGQMALYSALGLSDGINAGPADSLTWGDCARLFYNLLDAKTKSGERKYAEALGYKLNKDGKVDIDAMLHTPTEGPVVVPAGGWRGVLPFTPATIYRNDAPADVQALQPWDVIYYSKGKQTVWAYARKITGTLEKVSPGREAPESVTVAGVEYKLGGDGVKAQLGPSGGLTTGSVVTLLLGRDGTAAAAYGADDLNTDMIGVVSAVGTASYMSANGTAYESPTLTLMGIDGQRYTVPSPNKLNTGSLVRVSFTSEGTKITNLTHNSTVGGKVNYGAGRIGQTPIAEGVQILDVSGKTAVKVYPSRLDRVTLTSENVLYSEKNTAGEISALILKDVTGDQYSYGLVLSVQERSEGMDLSGTYRVLVDGQETTYSLSGRLLSAKQGPARIVLKDAQLNGIRSLSELKNVDSISGVTLKAGGETHTIWDNAVAYLYAGQQYRKIDRNELDSARYQIRAYYDAPDSQGGRVRILVAVPK